MRLAIVAFFLISALLCGCAAQGETENETANVPSSAFKPPSDNAPNATSMENASVDCAGEGCGDALRARCCAECHEAYSKSPVAMGPSAARCGHFMTGAPLSPACEEYFGTNPPTVSRCE